MPKIFSLKSKQSVCTCTGLVTNYFFKMFTFRAVAMTGAFLFVLGSVWAIFARSMLELIFAFGILEGMIVKSVVIVLIRRVMVQL